MHIQRRVCVDVDDANWHEHCTAYTTFDVQMQTNQMTNL